MEVVWEVVVAATKGIGGCGEGEREWHSVTRRDVFCHIHSKNIGGKHTHKTHIYTRIMCVIVLQS